MSTYAVFGMTRPRAVEMARKKVPTSYQDPSDRRRILHRSEREWEVEVQAAADATMAGTMTVQLSEKYDAPHYAFAYLELARKNGGRGLHVKSYAKTGQTHPKSGKPIFEWKLVLESDLDKEPERLFW